MLYVLSSDLIINRLLNENLIEDNRRESVLLILYLRFADKLDPSEYKLFFVKAY